MEKDTVAVDPLRPRMELEVRMERGSVFARGGTGYVQAVTDTNLQRDAVLKALRKDFADRENARGLLIEEAQITAQLDHPNIVPVYEMGIDDAEQLFFTMKRVYGETLSQLISGVDPIERNDAELYEHLQIFIKVCDAIGFANSRGVIHRDVKPDNIMVGKYGQVYMMDWGAAMLTESVRPTLVGDDLPNSGGRHRYDVSRGGMLYGTPNYMAPEQTYGDEDLIDQRTDVYCLGGVLYKILTHRSPHRGETAKQMVLNARRGKVTPPSEVVDARLHPKLCRIAMKALAKDPSERYLSALEIKDEIEGFLQSDWRFPVLTFKPGARIITEGDTGDEAFIVRQGRCAVFRENKGKKILFGELGPGDVFGETAVFANQPRTANVEALDEVSVMVVERKHFEQELGMGYWLGLFVNALTDRFKEKNLRVEELEAEIARLKEER